MAVRKDEVIIIKSVNFSEADKILTVFGLERGKFSIIAKGIRRIKSRNRGNLQTLTNSKITYFEGRNLGVLKESEFVSAPEWDDIDSGALEKILFFMNKIIPEDEPDKRLFEQLVELGRNAYPLELVNKFRLMQLIRLGYVADLRECYTCGRGSKGGYFDPAELIVICRSCYKGIESRSRGRFREINQVPYTSGVMTEAVDRSIRDILDS